VRSYISFLTLIVLFLFNPDQAKAQLPQSVSDSAQLSLITIFPGQPVYSAWGHSAFRIFDPETGLDASFNFGTFDTSVPYFIPRFAYGDMLYQLSASPTSALIRNANSEERAVVEQVLRLEPEQLASVYALLLDNLSPENRSYQYDFVYDNCSTRLLDLLFAVHAIALPEEDPFGTTFRHMLDEFIHDRALLDLGIDMVIGSSLDRTPTMQQRTFLPTYLMDILDLSTTPSGEPIVREKNSLLSFEAPSRGPYLPWTFWVTLVACFMAVVVWWRRGTLPVAFDRWLFGFTGFVGLFLLAMWLLTLHHVTSGNWNVAWALPTHLILAVFWHKIPRKDWYLKAAGIWTAGVAILSLIQPQAIPPAAWPIVVLLIVRLLMHSRTRLPSSGR